MLPFPGVSARRVSACRPGIPILALTTRLDVCRQLVLAKGVLPVHTPTGFDTLTEFTAAVERLCLESGLAKPGRCAYGGVESGRRGEEGGRVVWGCLGGGGGG
jgi:pyruvate kinase